jgi:hypothetical protein
VIESEPWGRGSDGGGELAGGADEAATRDGVAAGDAVAAVGGGGAVEELEPHAARAAPTAVATAILRIERGRVVMGRLHQS